MKKVIKYIPLLFAAALLAGCLKDSFGDVSGKDGFIEIELGLEIEDEGLSLTRAFSPEQEDRVETIDVLVFEYDATVSGYGKFRYSTHGYDINRPESIKTFKTMLATEYNDGGNVTSLIGKPVFLLVIANARGVWDQVKGSVSTNSTFKTVVNKLIFEQPGNWDTSAGSTQYFPMASLPGGYHTLTGYSKGSDFGKIKLMRAIAAIDIGFNYDGDTPYGFSEFTLEKVVLCNLSDRGLVSSATSYNVNVIPRTPSYQIVERSYEPGTPSRNGIFNEIYLPEMNLVDVSLHPERHPYLLIGGKYNGVPSWYKILFPTSQVELAEGGTVTVSMTLHRNCRHIFKIDRIDGPGYPTREEAEAGKGGDSKLWMNLTVVPFSQRTVPAELDGPYIFDVSQTEFYFENDEQGDVTVDLYTDYAGGWRMEEITYENDPGQGVEGFWIHTDIIKGVPFEQGQLTIRVSDCNYTDNGRVGYVHLSAGRWKYKIKVQQGEIIPLSVTPASRTISFWSHRNGPTPQNTFTVEGANTDWDYEVSYLTAWEGGLTVHKTDDGQGFYVQCDRNEDDAPRRANVTITSSGGSSVTVQITQDWADCGIGGVTKPAYFGGVEQEYVETHLFGGNAFRALMRWWKITIENALNEGWGENWREDPDMLHFYEEVYAREYEEWKKNIPDKEYYACWMVENSKYYEPDATYYGGSDPVGDAEKIGPYYSYENAPNACPEGWKLPEFFELVAMVNMGVMLELAEPGSDEMLAVDLWKSQPGAFPGGYHNYESGNYEWQGWGEQGFFHTTWDGIYHLNPETQYNAIAPIALYLGLESLIDGNAPIDVPGPMGADSKFAVRCVKDKTYSYE